MRAPGGSGGLMPPTARGKRLADRAGGRVASPSTRRLAAFLDASPATVLVEVTEAKGSTPREKGAWMLVSRHSIHGTIGGGHLEYIAIDKAWQMLRGGGEGVDLDIPLGPDIGQCCGGRVGLGIRLLGSAEREALLRREAQEDAARPSVFLFGGGHVGYALATALSLLPLNITVVETRAEALAGLPEDVETVLTPVPEEAVRSAPAGSAFLVLTHDHALDFLIAAEALGRDDAAYIGMIGSMTKKATFRSWYLKEAGGSDAAFSRLVSPIGGGEVKDKRPAVIAALAAAEVMQALSLPSA